MFICVASSLSFLLSGCGLWATIDDNVAAQAKTEPSPTPTVGNVAAAEEKEATVAASPTASPTPTPVSSPSPTPTVGPMPIPTVKGPPYTYHTVGFGETLSYIAWRYGITIEELVAMNNLSGPSALIKVDQALRVPAQIDTTAPGEPLLPDSEVVYSPAYVDFDIAQFVAEQGGYLATYRQHVGGEQLSGAEVVERVAEQFSVGPRLLLALLEHYSGWVTNLTPSPQELNRPLGPRNPYGNDLYFGLGFTANRVNAGYYNYKRDGFWIFRLADRSQAITPTGVNAGTVGVQNLLAIHANKDSWPEEVSERGFIATYGRLFGDPFEKAIEPLIPANLTQPPLALPWRPGQGFYLTGGPHPAYFDGTAWAAIDFGPPDALGHCFYSSEPNTAAADGLIVTARQGEVQLDLDGDGYIQTGWVLFYLHAALDLDTPIQAGQHVKEGDVIGYASCEGGESNSSHLHFARRYNGEWIEAGGATPMTLSGWVVQPTRFPYSGFITNGDEVREPCECWEPETNLIIRDQTEE